MDEPVRVQVLQRGRQREPDVDALPRGQPFFFPQLTLQRPRRVIIGIDFLAGVNVIAQLHDVVKQPRQIVAPDVQNIHLRTVRPRHWLKFADAIKLALIRPLAGKTLAPHNLHRPPGPHHILRQPHLPISPPPDDADERMVRDVAW